MNTILLLSVLLNGEVTYTNQIALFKTEETCRYYQQHQKMAIYLPFVREHRDLLKSGHTLKLECKDAPKKVNPLNKRFITVSRTTV